MRTLILPLFMAALIATAAKPGKMFVVVHTTDGIVEDYVCTTLSGTNDASIIVRSQIKSQGSFIWHVTGGVAPYTVVQDNSQGPYGGCVTVMDAEGNQATGCGVVGQKRILVPVQCPGMNGDSLMYKSKVRTPKPAEKENNAQPLPTPPTTEPVTPIDHGSTKDPVGPGKEPVDLGPDAYRPPIKVFSPVTNPPPPPPPPTTNGHTGTYPVKQNKEYSKPGGNSSPVHTGSSGTTRTQTSKSGPTTPVSGGGSGGSYHKATKQPSAPY